MAIEVVMPKLGMAMNEGTVSVWNKGVGDSVAKGEPIASVNSEKIEIDVESPSEGTVLKITVPEGEGVPPGTVIAYIGTSGEEIIFDSHMEIEEKPEIKNPAKSEPVAAAPILSANPAAGRVKISPVAKKMAEAANLDIETIQGTGPGGRITKEDVQEAIKNARSAELLPKEKSESAAPLLQQNEDIHQVPVSGMRKVIAARMYNSLQNSAQLTITMKADVTDLLALQKQTAETILKLYENKLTITDYIARAVVRSLKQHPLMNSAYIENKIHTFHRVHLGLAVALEKGLVVPVIQNADSCTLLELSKNMKTLAEKARQGKLTTEEMQGSTFTITSLGSFGVEFFTPVLNPPETGILGVGTIYDTPVYIGEKLERRSLLPLSLTFDHRVLDGAPASAFLRMVKQFLEEPITMLI